MPLNEENLAVFNLGCCGHEGSTESCCLASCPPFFDLHVSFIQVFLLFQVFGRFQNGLCYVVDFVEAREKCVGGLSASAGNAVRPPRSSTAMGLDISLAIVFELLRTWYRVL